MGGKRQFLTVLFSLFLFPALFAGGSQEADSIEQARMLIVEKQFDQAIMILSAIIDKNGERMDEAEELLNQVRTIRGDYNDLFERLYDTILNEPENNDKILGIINQMLALDKNPNPKTREQLEKARLTAKIQVDRRLRSRIMDEARLLIEGGLYADAIAKYASGFDLQKPEFENGIQSAEFKKFFLDQVAAIQAEVPKIGPDELALKDWFTIYDNNFTPGPSAPDPQRASSSLAQLSVLYERINLDRNRIMTLADAIKQGRIQAETEWPAYIFNEYTRFIQEFMIGPPGKTGREGMVAALNLQRSNAVSAWMKPLDTEIRRLRSDLLVFLEQDQLDLAALTLVQLRQWYAQSINGAFIASSIPRPANFVASTFQDVDPLVRDQLARHWLFDQADLRLATYLADWGKRPPEPAPDANYATLATAYTESVKFLSANDEVWTSWLALHELPLASSPELKADQLLLDGQLAAWRSRLSDEILAVNLNTLSRLATFQYGDADTRYVSAQKELASVSTLIDGADSGALGIVKRYPDQALNIILAQEPVLTQAIALLDETLLRNRESHPSLRSQASIVQANTRATSLRNAILALQTRSLAWKTSAQTNIAKARDLQLQAEGQVRLTQTAIRDKNLAQAETRLQAVSDLYFDALELQDSVALRTTSDKTKLDLEGAINELKKDLAIARVRTLINSATTSLDREDYETALQNVEEGEQLYTSVFPGTPNIELAKLKQRILASSSLTRERFFTEADPAYNTLANYMNLARVDVEKARSIAGQVRLDRLKRASQSLENILLIKPNNYDARLLKLEIAKIIDPEEFSRSLPNRIREILSQERLDNKNTTLTELQVLEAYAPENRTIKAEIKRLRIELGLQPSDVTIARRNEAARLYQLGLTQSKSRDLAVLAQALANLERSLDLNPDNDPAKILADTVRIKVGNPPSAVLSAADEQLLRRAQRAYANSEYLGAYDIVQTLWRSANNQKHPKVIELKANVEQKLNQ